MKKLLIIPLLLAGCVEHEPQLRDPLICEYPVIVEDEIVFRPILDPGCFRDDRDDRASPDRAEEREEERTEKPEHDPEPDREKDEKAHDDWKDRQNG